MSLFMEEIVTENSPLKKIFLRTSNVNFLIDLQYYNSFRITM